jgi:integrase
MKGYIAKKGHQYYAVIYEGLDPVTGKEQRRWHPAGPDKAAAEALASRLAAELEGRDDKTRSLTFGAYLTDQWLPGKANTLAESTWHGYRRKIERHILPTLGGIPIRRLNVADLEGLYDAKLRPTEPNVKALAPKTVLEIHLIIRGALKDAVKRGMLTHNVGAVAHAPRLRSIPKHEAQAWTAAQLQAFLHAAGGHRLFPALWVAANTGVRRSELLGLRWGDIDLDKATMSINRALVAIGYELTESRGKTANSRRSIDLDATTVDVLTAWRTWQSTERLAAHLKPTDRVFTGTDGQDVHPHAISQAFERIARRAGVPVVRFHDLRHTHATLLIKEGVPVKVVSERLGHATTAFTMETYQHVLPGMQADAARTFARLIDPSTGEGRRKTRKKTA